MPSADASPRSDAELLEAVRPKGARALIRRLGCPVVLAFAGWLSWRAGVWVGEHTVGWLTWVATPILFVPVGVLFSALVAAAAGAGDPEAGTELQRRLGQRPLPDAVEAVHADLAEVAPGQRGWVVLLQGRRMSDGFRFQVRADLRTDTEPVQGEIRGARGPKLDLWINPPRALDRWERRSEPLRADAVTELAAWLDGAELAALPAGTPLRGELRFEGVVVRMGEATNQWKFGGGIDGNDDSPLAALAYRLLAALDWDPGATAAR